MFQVLIHDILNIIGRTYSELYCDTNRYVLAHTKYKDAQGFFKLFIVTF